MSRGLANTLYTSTMIFAIKVVNQEAYMTGSAKIQHNYVWQARAERVSGCSPSKEHVQLLDNHFSTTG